MTSAWCVTRADPSRSKRVAGASAAGPCGSLGLHVTVGSQSGDVPEPVTAVARHLTYACALVAKSVTDRLSGSRGEEDVGRLTFPRIERTVAMAHVKPHTQVARRRIGSLFRRGARLAERVANRVDAPASPASVDLRLFDRINVGCGYDKRPGYLNIDVDPAARPNLLVVGDDTSAVPRDHFVEVFAKDVLEHIPRAKTMDALLELAAPAEACWQPDVGDE